MGDLSAVSPTASGTAYDERLHVPLRWWVQGAMFLATVWIAVILWVPAALAWTVTGVLVLLFALMMMAYGGARVIVDGRTFTAGKAHIDARYVAAATSLTAEEAWQVAGPKADARAFLLLRPYLKRAVKVDIADPADPTPYWLVATRHPDRLAAALTALTTTAR